MLLMVSNRISSIDFNHLLNASSPLSSKGIRKLCRRYEAESVKRLNFLHVGSQSPIANLSAIAKFEDHTPPISEPLWNAFPCDEKTFRFTTLIIK